ncbi:MAG: DUF4126 domain-containing protein [Chloroflexota bacterium]|nr:DUF4126 domain-containing protein [Chloroflexota bacterium]
MEVQLLLSIALGVGLSAACGFRIFVPFTIMSIAALGGYLDLANSFAWIGTYPALIAFATATVLEVAAYYVPWLDNLLDTLTTPAAIIAGTIATASVVTDMSPLLTWVLAVIAGGGTAGIIQAGTALLRGTSSATTGGLGNPVIATGELAGSIFTSVLALALPGLALLVAVVFLIIVIRRLTRRRSHVNQVA